MQIPLGFEAIGTGAPSPSSSPKNAEDAARQFEAILIEQMLKSAQAGGGGEWMGQEEAGSAMTEMAEQQFAQMLANGGGIGLAKLVTKGLDRP